MTTQDADNAWRPVVAALANDEALEVFAKVVLGEDPAAAVARLFSKKRERVLRTLISGGLLTEQSDASGRLQLALPFASLLAMAPVRPRTGVDRFIKDGRLERYPMAADDRRQVLTWIAQHALHSDEELTEAQLNERLKVFSRDYATLRRYLVDCEIVERTRSGSSYALAASEDPTEAHP